LLRADLKQVTRATVKELDSEDKALMVRQHYHDIVTQASDETIAVNKIMTKLKDKDYANMLVERWKEAKRTVKYE
jgi:hypothetical protein